jgi:5-carboxymethyl-2-hydroxymuconate isomerase
MVISRKSKLQKPLALSSSEAEYYGMSEAAKDVKFVDMILEVYASNSKEAKHVDMRYHFCE